MKKATGPGGFFFKCEDTAATSKWYREHLCLKGNYGDSGHYLWWEDETAKMLGFTAWSPFAADTTYFGPDSASFMLNFRVHDLDSLLAELRAADVWIDEKIDDYDFGRFAWIKDPEGHRIELWQPSYDPEKNAGFDEMAQGGFDRTLGVAAFYFKSKDPAALSQWYQHHLGLPVDELGVVRFSWRRYDEPSREESFIWQPLPADHPIFEGSDGSFVIRYLVRDFDTITGGWDRESKQEGNVLRFIDPNGFRVELTTT